MENIKNYIVLISCPSDIEEDYILVVKSVLNEVNKYSEKYKKIKFIPKYWKNDVPPGYGNVQELINRSIVKEADIVVALFKTQLGSPTNNYESGSVEEIYIMAQNGKIVIVCFYEGFADLKRVNPEELGRLRKFQSEYGKQGLYLQYTSVEDLKEKLLNTFELYIKNIDSIDKLVEPEKSNEKKETQAITSHITAEKIDTISFNINN